MGCSSCGGTKLYCAECDGQPRLSAGEAAADVLMPMPVCLAVALPLALEAALPLPECLSAQTPLPDHLAETSKARLAAIAAGAAARDGQPWRLAGRKGGVRSRRGGSQ